VPVTAAPIDAVNDAGASVNGFTGGTSVSNVLTNDTLNGVASISLPLLAGPLVAIAGIGALAVVSVGSMVVPIVMLLRLRETSPGHYAH
jgi:hypothetical protein